MWVEAKSNSNNPNRDAIPSIRTLVKDADEIEEMLKTLSDALEEVDQEVRSEW